MFGKVKDSKYDDLAVGGQPYCPYNSKPYDKLLVLMDLDGVSRTHSEEYPGQDVDFKKLLIEAVDGRDCIAAFAVYTESCDMSARKLLRRVSDCGFRLESVPDLGSEKGDSGIAIALIAQEYALKDWCDRIVLMTGGIGSAYLARNLQRRGKIVEVLSFDERAVADKVVPMSRMPLIRVDVPEEASL